MHVHPVHPPAYAPVTGFYATIFVTYVVRLIKVAFDEKYSNYQKSDYTFL